MAAALGGIAGYFDLVPGAHELMTRWGRATGFFKDPNVFGPFLIPALVYALSRLSGAPLRKSLLPLGVLGVVGFAILLSFSRGAWFNLAVAVGLLRRAPRPDRAQQLGAAQVHRAGGRRRHGRSQRRHRRPAVRRGRRPALRARGADAELRRGARGPLRRPGEGGAPHRRQSARASARSSSCRATITRSRTTSTWRCSSMPAGSAASCSSGSSAPPPCWACATPCARGATQPLFLVVYACFVANAFEGLVIDLDHWRHFYLLMAMVWGMMLSRDPPPRPSRGEG